MVQRSGAGHFHIPKGWFYDLNTYDASELLGGTIGAVALVFSWNRADTEAFAKMVGGMGLSAAISANPLLLVTVVALARAFQKARQTGEYTEFVDGQIKGGIGAGTTLTAVALVGVAGGPAGAALLAGLTAGILVNAATKKVQHGRGMSIRGDEGSGTRGRSEGSGRRPDRGVTGTWWPVQSGVGYVDVGQLS